MAVLSDSAIEHEQMEGNREPVRIGADRLVNVGWAKHVPRARWVVALNGEMKLPVVVQEIATISLDSLNGDDCAPAVVIVRVRLLTVPQRDRGERPTRRVIP